MDAAAILNSPVQTTWPLLPKAKLSLWIICSNLGIGGAERLIAESVEKLASTPQIELTITVFVLEKRGSWSYLEEPLPGVDVVLLTGLAEDQKIARIVARMRQHGAKLAFTHTLGIAQLRLLWAAGVETMPVVHNMPRGWSFPPSQFSPASCPLAVCTTEATASLVRSEGCPVPVEVIRFELSRWFHPGQVEQMRRDVRSLHAIGDEVFLIGMVGSFKLHKSYTVAVRVLHALRRTGFPARLIILGGWDHKHGAGKLAYLTAMNLALKLKVLHHITALGSITQPTPYFAAFDLFLNTSIYEAASVATMEAVRIGCPVVTSDVGGQREIVPPGAGLLVSGRGDPKAYSDAILAIASSKPPRVPPSRPPEDDMVASLWPLMQSYGGSAGGAPVEGTPRVAFITSNLNHGGPQTSLVKLAESLCAQLQLTLIVLDEATNSYLVDRLSMATVKVFSAAPLRSVTAKTAAILQWLDVAGVSTICFWNCRAELKLLISKVLNSTQHRLLDVSPGPMLFDELEAAEPFTHRIGYSLHGYLARLNALVHKYSAPRSSRFETILVREHVIPNGIHIDPKPFIGKDIVRRGNFNYSYALVTTGRIVADKRIDTLLRILHRVRRSVPEATLTIVGGVDQRHIGYYKQLERLTEELGLMEHVAFAGAQPNVRSFLSGFSVFVMHSRRQGCPNASLEAMEASLPVVANDDGGTSEQVLDGVTGFLVDSPDDDAFADRVVRLLNDPAMARQMGARGRDHVVHNFSQSIVSQKWLDLIHSLHEDLPVERTQY